MSETYLCIVCHNTRLRGNKKIGGISDAGIECPTCSKKRHTAELEAWKAALPEMVRGYVGGHRHRAVLNMKLSNVEEGGLTHEMLRRK